MLAGISKPLIFVVISALVVALVCGSFTPFIVFAVPPDPRYASATCSPIEGKPPNRTLTCCWREPIPGSILGQKYCQTCDIPDTSSDTRECKPKEKQSLTAPPTAGGNILQEEGVIAPLTEDESVLQQDEVLQEPPPSQSLGPFAPLQGGVLQQPPPADLGAAELPPPPTEETQPATLEEDQPVPVCQEGLEFNEDLGFCVPTACPEGQVLDEESGICVLEEQPAAAEEPEEQQQPEGEQSSEESGSEEDNSNN